MSAEKKPENPLQSVTKQGFVLYFKGCLIGLADVIPGVSGGTVAFASGIYKNLVGALAGLHFKDLFLIRPFLLAPFSAESREELAGKERGRQLSLLMVVGVGMLSSVFLFARWAPMLMQNWPFEAHTMFFTLILFSLFFPLSEIKKWSWSLLAVCGVSASFTSAVLLSHPNLELAPTMLNLFLSGAVAINAMILPGVSGAYFLLVLGLYEDVLNFIRQLSFAHMAVFAAGCGTGILAFSRILKWLFHKHHDLTISLLVGFIAGSLVRLWPAQYYDAASSSAGIAVLCFLLASAVMVWGIRVSLKKKMHIDSEL